MYGGIEAGGTKFVCAVAPEPNGTAVNGIVIPTKRPEETLARTIAFFSPYKLDGLGIASFGPLDLCENSSTFGYITSTAKRGWTNCDLLTPLRIALRAPIKI